MSSLPHSEHKRNPSSKLLSSVSIASPGSQSASACPECNQVRRFEELCTEARPASFLRWTKSRSMLLRDFGESVQWMFSSTSMPACEQSRISCEDVEVRQLLQLTSALPTRRGLQPGKRPCTRPRSPSRCTAVGILRSRT